VISFPAADGAPAPAVAAAPAAAPAPKPEKAAAKTAKTTKTSKAAVVEPAPAPKATSSKTTASKTTVTPAASGPEPSDLALAQRPPAEGKKTSKGRIETEEVSPLPAAAPPATPPSPTGPVTLAPARGAAPTASSMGSQPGVKAPIGKPVDVSPPTTPLQGLAQRNANLNQRDKQYFGEPIDLKVTNADVTDVLRTFAQISGLNVIVQPGVQGTVTAELENVPWDQALEEVLRINNLDYELDGNVMRIAPTDVLRKEAQERQQLSAAKALSIPLRTVYQRLSYANANQVATLLRTGQAGLLTQRGSVVVDRRTNALIIKELPSNMDAVLSVVNLLDAPEPQVMIEARIVETTKRFSRDIAGRRRHPVPNEGGKAVARIRAKRVQRH
jgi:hypothetical protein